jgi:uncharacterized protein (TIGR03437 family)
MRHPQIEDFRRRRSAGTAAILMAVAASAACAQTLTTLYTFTGGTDGAAPKGQLVQGPDGSFYGTTSGPGTVFKIAPSGTITTLHTINGAADGTGVFGNLSLGTDGNFYGTTVLGGAGNLASGTVFRITPTGAFTTLYTFHVLDGNSPWAGLTLGADGNFYGTTTSGGTLANGGIGAGTIFKITPGGGLTTLHVFSGMDGGDPIGGLVQGSDGAFYGTTALAAPGAGAIFKITPGGTFTMLHEFDGTDGGIPWGTLVQGSDGNFYGTTTVGGAFSQGTVFKITPAGVLTTLHSFNGADGQGPLAGLILGKDGNFYGDAQTGGASTLFGTIFKITPQGAYTLLYSFAGTDGSFPYGALTLGSDGNFYGTTDGGGKDAVGTVFMFNPNGGTVTSSFPAIKSGGVVSAGAFGQFSSIAPGTWIEIYGSNLAADARSWTGADFNGPNAPISLDGTSVTIGGQAAFIDYISPGQVNAQIPSSVAAGPQPLVVATAAGASNPYAVTVNATEPGLFAPSSFNIGGKQYVAALFSDGVTYAIPPGAIAGVPSRRAQPGDNLTFYGIGFGPIAPNTPAGQIVPTVNSLTLPFNLFFDQTQAQATYDGLAPGAVGLYQFNVIVPSIAASDATPLTFTLGGAAGTQMLYIAVQ